MRFSLCGNLKRRQNLFCFNCCLASAHEREPWFEGYLPQEHVRQVVGGWCASRGSGGASLSPGPPPCPGSCRISPFRFSVLSCVLVRVLRGPFPLRSRFPIRIRGNPDFFEKVFSAAAGRGEPPWTGGMWTARDGRQTIPSAVLLVALCVTKRSPIRSTAFLRRLCAPRTGPPTPHVFPFP